MSTNSEILTRVIACVKKEQGLYMREHHQRNTMLDFIEDDLHHRRFDERAYERKNLDRT